MIAVKRINNMDMALIAAGFPGIPWLYSRHHHGGSDAHALATLIVLTVVVVFIAWAFRRKPN